MLLNILKLFLAFRQFLCLPIFDTKIQTELLQRITHRAELLHKKNSQLLNFAISRFVNSNVTWQQFRQFHCHMRMLRKSSIKFGNHVIKKRDINHYSVMIIRRITTSTSLSWGFLKKFEIDTVLIRFDMSSEICRTVIHAR